MTVCQKCSKAIPDSHGRWMFRPEGLPLPSGFHLDKCQPCGAWTPAEEAMATQKLAQIVQTQLGGCNCAGKR